MTGINSLNLKQKGLFIIGFLLAIELGLVAFLGVLLYQAEEAVHQESAARDLVAGLNYSFLLSEKAHDAATYFVGTGKPELNEKFFETKTSLQAELKELKKNAEPFPECKEPVEKVLSALANSEELWTRMVTLRVSSYKSDWDKAGALRKSGEKSQDQDERLSAFYALQDRTAKIVKRKSAENLRYQVHVTDLLIAGVSANIVLALILSLAFSRGITSRLNVLVDNSKRLATERELNAPLKEPDEIGDLDRVFHSMAGALKEAARKDRALTDNARDVIFSLEGGKFIKTNPAIEESWGYSANEILGRAPEEIIDGDTEQFKRELNRCSQSGENLEARILCKNGSSIDTVWSVHRSEQDNCTFCVVHDISERKRDESLLQSREMRLRSILNNMIVGLLTVSQDGKIESANPRIERLLQYKSEELIGHPLSLIFPAIKVSDITTFLNQPQQELEAHSQTGLHVPVELSIGKTGTGDASFLLSVIDITERRAMQQAKQEFLDVIGEDLSGPLNAVQVFLKKLADEGYCKLAETGKQRTTLAANNIGRLLRLLDDLFQMNELESGQLELRPSEIALGDIVQRAVEAVRVFAEQHHITLNYPEVNIQLSADGDRLERVLVNLLSNAVKFSPENETVTIAIDDEIENIVVKVIDRGRGIPESHKDLIFAAFRQVAVSDATKKGGTGLGLAICKAVIEQHGGTIGVDSIEGNGSTFWFRLPKLKTPAHTENPESISS